MKIDKSLMSGSTTMLILKLLENKDLYGYEMIELLRSRSNDMFTLKAGTLYPLLHGLENKGVVLSYDAMSENGRKRKYYKLTTEGKSFLRDKEREWTTYTKTVNKILQGGALCGTF